MPGAEHRPHPGRQHLRGQRGHRRHRGHAERADGSLLARHALPVEVGAHRQRRAAQRAVLRRPAVLRGPVLPGARHGHALHRREAVGDPGTGGGRQLPGDADHPQPRREGGRPGDPDGRRVRLRRPLPDQGRDPEQEGRAVRRGRVGPAAPGLPAGQLPARDRRLRQPAGPLRPARLRLEPAAGTQRAVGRRHRRADVRHRSRRPGPADRAARARRRAARAPARPGGVDQPGARS